MATVYFTNNADSGDGSLRAALVAASSGDVVTYADGYFDGSDEIVISLSSRLAPTKDVVLDARDKRIVLDGQFTSRCLWASADLQLRKVDLINGYSDSSFSGGLYISSGAGAVTLDACRIHGCFCKSYGSALYAYSGSVSVVLNDCLITGCCTETAQVSSASVRADSGSSVAINRCTIVGDTQRALSAGTDGQIVVADSLVQGVYNVSSAVSVTPSTCGFVAPCPDTIDLASWTNTLWQSWDFRLKPTSPYLTGAETLEGEVDVLGHTRKVNGAIGAYEGSWVVGGQTITEDTTVDYCDFKSTDTISFTGEDRFLSVKEAAYIDGATFTAENRSYLAVPAIGSIINTSFSDNIRICEYSANVQSITSSISEDVAVFSIVKANEKNIVIDWSTDSGLNWHICVLNESNQVVLTSSKNHIFRVFDGINFVVTDEIPRTYFSADSVKNISLTNSTDWYLDSARTKACNDSPSINSCVFKIQ
jgi:hypothetical protein